MTAKRTLVCGDVHGAKKALLQVLERCEFNNLEDQLIFLGDYVDGWSESCELVDYLINLIKTCTFKPIFIKGNHDQWALDWLKHGKTPIIWMQNGGVSTVESYIKNAKNLNKEHLEFFENLKIYHIDKDNNGFVHGGFNSKKGLGNEIYDSVYYWDRNLWENALLHSDTYNDSNPNVLDHLQRYKTHNKIFLGHTPTNNFKCKPHYPEYNDPNQDIKNGWIIVPMKRCNIINLDTGCGWDGKLSIIDINNEEYWQSDFVSSLYPNEKGRK
jgi:serine/threonine protein phosphatase 1